MNENQSAIRKNSPTWARRRKAQPGLVIFSTLRAGKSGLITRSLVRYQLVALLLVGLGLSQSAFRRTTPSESLLQAWGDPASFSLLYRQAIDAFFMAEQAYRHADYTLALQILDDFWATHPTGTREWESAVPYAQILGRTKGINFGTPGCYNALRMLTDCVRWRIRAAAAAPATAHIIRLTVLLVGNSSGTEPHSMKEVQEHAGSKVRHKLDASLLSDGGEIINQALFLFAEYISAITEGRLRVEVKRVLLPDLDVPVEAGERRFSIASLDRSLLYADLAPTAVASIWKSVPTNVRAVTDWWWIIYPSHVPQSCVECEQSEFITGGMVEGPDGSPAFLIDDLWLIRNPPHLGSGRFTEAERRAWLPQWLQHEFFHHLYRTYPEFRLESTSHQWFDRTTWPPDFDGRLEADYYAESVHRRLQSAKLPMHVALRYASPPQALLSKITSDMVRGKYRSEPLLNDWLQGTIEWDMAPGKSPTETLRWLNSAGVSWHLTPDLKNGQLQTGVDNPYFVGHPVDGRAFRIILRRDTEGEYLPEVSGFKFLNVFYAKKP
jgi:hypothetical protein